MTEQNPAPLAAPTLERIKTWLEVQGQPSYRYAQVEHAWYTANGWDAVTTLSQDLRAALAAEFPWNSIPEARAYTSEQDGTQKAAMKLADGAIIESVNMPNTRDRRTVCISSQVGCAMGCTFCATGSMGLTRNLTSDEIIDQMRYWLLRDDAADISNIVFMGMGEPMANYPAVVHAARTFIEKMEIGPTHVTISTVGIKAGLQRIINDPDFPPVRVALSIHAGTDETRGKIVPSHQYTSMQDLADWAAEYVRTKGNRQHHVTLEYVMLAGVNDMLSEAEALAKQFAEIAYGIKCNLIPWNPTDDTLAASSEHTLEQFQAVLENGGITTTVRYSKGLDIDAACGQLANKTVSNMPNLTLPC